MLIGILLLFVLNLFEKNNLQPNLYLIQCVYELFKKDMCPSTMSCNLGILC